MDNFTTVKQVVDSFEDKSLFDRGDDDLIDAMNLLSVECGNNEKLERKHFQFLNTIRSVLASRETKRMHCQMVKVTWIAIVVAGISALSSIGMLLSTLSQGCK